MVTVPSTCAVLVVVFTCVVLVGCEKAGEATKAVAMADAIKSFILDFSRAAASNGLEARGTALGSLASGQKMVLPMRIELTTSQRACQSQIAGVEEGVHKWKSGPALPFQPISRSRETYSERLRGRGREGMARKGTSGVRRISMRGDATVKKLQLAL